MQRHTFPFHAMACDSTISLFAETQAAAKKAANAAIAEVRRIESKYSRYRSDSMVQYINLKAGCGVSVKIDPETALLLDFADSCHRNSGGLFDITSGVLRRVWDFRADAPPTDEAIAGVLPLIGWTRVVRDATSIYLPETGMEIDFGGFGKEYAADRAAAFLLAHGVQHGFVDLGGDVVVTGAQADGAPWSLGVRHPREADALTATLEITSGAIATSGDYERFIDWNDRRYSHILDPRTGESVQSFQSVTVLAPSCLLAGSISTIAMLKGEVEGSAWLFDLGTQGGGQSIGSLAVGADGGLQHYP